MALTSPRTEPHSEDAERAAVPVIQGLEQARSVIEQRFLAAGEVLALAVQGVGGLIGALDELSGALDPATVATTRAELGAAAHSLLGLRERLSERRERTRGLNRLVGTLSGGIDDMRRDLAYLRVFAINIKVTAAGVAGAGDDFALFAQEISDRIESGRLEVERFAVEVSALSHQLSAALAQEQTLAADCELLIPSVPDALTASAADIAGHHEKVARVAADVRELAQDIQRKVGAALAALQVGDSTRQRIEHVQLGLSRLAAVCPDPQARGPLAAAVTPLLAALLGSAGEEFHRDAAQIHRSMAGIAASASELLRLRDLAFGATDGEGFLDRMTVHLDQALSLVGRTEAAEADALSTGRAAVAAVADLTRRIAELQAIKTDVQQMALNTTLKCARIGDAGKPLSVIAIEMRSHAGLLETSAQRALATLETLAADAGRMAEDHGEGGSAEAALNAATARLRKANAAVEADLAQVAQQGETVVRALGEAAGRLDFHGEIGKALDAAAALLDRGRLGADAAQADPAMLADVLQAVAKAYTMAQEREIHATLTAGLAAAAPTAAPAPATDELDAVLF